ncbi:MAG: hypothetical protein O7B99_08325 [Planctomycetota bacterium]|nr:hypothetical protein [Planctomycetota bacterium]
MTRTARRRWTREIEGEIDGIALIEAGPILLHCYDPPAGGKWIDNVIPGKLGAFDRNSGETLWVSPCEVGYGRGFGAGLGSENDAVVMGPSIKGHLIARMKLETGELIGAQDIQPFDHALVYGDLCFAVTPNRVTGIMTSAMLEVWSFQREGERYHLIDRDGDRLYVVFTDQKLRRQGVLWLEVDTGEFGAELLPPELGVIHDMAVGQGIAILLAGAAAPAPGAERLALLGVSLVGDSGGHMLWHEPVHEEGLGGLPDISIGLDSGKLYVARGALLIVRDALTGRALGETTVPGLDEHVAWKIEQGAGLLAEETRASVFEIPD